MLFHLFSKINHPVVGAYSNLISVSGDNNCPGLENVEYLFIAINPCSILTHVVGPISR